MRTLKTFLVLLLIKCAVALIRITDDAVIIEGA